MLTIYNTVDPLTYNVSSFKIYTSKGGTLLYDDIAAHYKNQFHETITLTEDTSYYIEMATNNLAGGSND